MTQESEELKKLAELHALFVDLDESGQDGALTILRSLGFAQSIIMCDSKQEEQPHKPPGNRSA